MKKLKYLILLLLINAINKCTSSQQLECYVCNSNYPKCGVALNFDASFQTTSYCSGYCLKITVFPGDFIIRTCSTLMNSITSRTNLTTVNPKPQECYIDTYTDPSSRTVSAYYCYCNDKLGCNRSMSISSYMARNLVASLVLSALLIWHSIK